jgi:BASS family bile acid:Na+ symporter
VTTQSWVTLINVTALVTIMLSMGLQVKVGAIAGSTRPVNLVFLGLLANYVLVPIVTIILLRLFRADSMVAVGFLILAVCPGAPIGPPAARLAKGNVAWAISMMVILAALSAILSPALLSGLLLWLAPGSDLQIDYLHIVETLVVAQLLPLAVGLAVHHWAPRLAGLLEKPLALVANVLLIVLVAIIVATQYETLADIRLRGWSGMILLLLASLAIGWICGGHDVAVRKSLAVTTCARNAAVGLAIATSNFAETPAVTAVVAYALVSIVGTLAFGAMLGRVPLRHAAVGSPGS